MLFIYFSDIGMNCVLFAKMVEITSIKKILENEKEYWKSPGIFVTPEKWGPCSLMFDIDLSVRFETSLGKSSVMKLLH